jgi:hypothetical protein
MRKERSELL